MKIKDLIKTLRRYYDLNQDVNDIRIWDEYKQVLWSLKKDSSTKGKFKLKSLFKDVEIPSIDDLNEINKSIKS